MAKLAFLGLGVMGFPMAGHLVAKGHSVTVYNRSPAKAQLWVEKYGQTSAANPALAAQGAEVVMACVGNDDDLRSVCLGPDRGASTKPLPWAVATAPNSRVTSAETVV